MLAEASPGPGERIVVAPIDITALRHERDTRQGHQMLAHLRTEAYPVYGGHVYPPALSAELSYERNMELIGSAKARMRDAGPERISQTGTLLTGVSERAAARERVGESEGRNPSDKTRASRAGTGVSSAPPSGRRR
jgi:hypothetical protein